MVPTNAATAASAELTTCSTGSSASDHNIDDQIGAPSRCPYLQIRNAIVLWLGAPGEAYVFHIYAANLLSAVGPGNVRRSGLARVSRV